MAEDFCFPALHPLVCILFFVFLWDRNTWHCQVLQGLKQGVWICNSECCVAPWEALKGSWKEQWTQAQTGWRAAPSHRTSKGFCPCLQYPQIAGEKPLKQQNLLTEIKNEKKAKLHLLKIKNFGHYCQKFWQAQCFSKPFQWSRMAS